MAKKSEKSDKVNVAKARTKKVAKTTGKVALAGYAWRLQITGGAAKRRAQKDAVRKDARRVKNVTKKTAKAAARTKPGQKVVNSKAGQATGRAYTSSAKRTKDFVGSGPGDMAKNSKKAVTGGAKKMQNRTKKVKKVRIKDNRPATTGAAKKKTPGRHKQAYNYGKSNPKARRIPGQKTSYRAAEAAGKTVSHVGKNKGKYAAGAAVGVAAGAGVAYAYKRRKAKKAAASTGTTYKRRTKSGKVITVRKGKRGKKIGAAAVHLGAYGSTRYTSKGAKNASRTKGVATSWAGSATGSVVGAAVGGVVGGVVGGGAGSAIGRAGGQSVGNFVGGTTGRNIARKRGYVKRTKKRMTVRAVNKAKGGKR